MITAVPSKKDDTIGEAQKKDDTQGLVTKDDTQGMVTKRRRLDPGNWERNKKKLQRKNSMTAGEIPSCRCKCAEKVPKADFDKIFLNFKNLLHHNEQNLYLRGCIRSVPAARSRNKNKVPRSVFKYSVTVNKKSISVCQKFFLSLHGIKRDRLRKKVLKFDKDIIDSRGKHTNRPRRTKIENINKVHEFLKNLPAIESHYSRTQNKSKKYLPSDSSVATLHKNYSQQFPENPVSYSIFYKIFNEDFNYSFSHPKKDICTTCTKFLADINSAKVNNNESLLKQLTLQKELHLRKAQNFFDNMKDKKDNPKQDELVICFDFQKNLPLPVTNIGDEYYLRQLWLHNFGINDIVTNQASMFLFTENFCSKGPNEVITCLDYYIRKYKKQEHRKLSIFCDNCFSQNKNRFLFTYLDAICASGMFQEVTIFYPIPGHSMMPIDRCFALIEKKRLKTEKINHPVYYINLIKTSRTKNPFEIVCLQHSLQKVGTCQDDMLPVLKVRDFKTKFLPRIKASIPGISQCRSATFSNNSAPKFRPTMTGPYQNFSLYKVGQQRFRMDQIPDEAYTKFLKLKEKNYRI